MKNNLKNILLVEDDLNFGSVLNDFLNLHSYNVVLAKNGIEGLEKFKKNEFGLCILDVMLPFKDGFTLAREIREIDKDVPLFFLTAKTLKDDVLKGYKLGADDYLTKPFDSDILLLKIKSIFKRKKITATKENTKFLYNFADFSFNSKLRTLKYNSETNIKLSPKEKSLLFRNGDIKSSKVKVYCFEISDGGALEFCESSFAQVNRSSMLRYTGSLFIKKINNYLIIREYHHNK